MTTIAWDGKTIAADTSGWYGNQRAFGEREKIVFAEGYCFAVCGVGAAMDPLVKWWIGSKDPKEVPPSCGKDGWSALVLSADEAWYLTDASNGYPTKAFPPFSIGSGEAEALGAMLAGADALRAVEIAAQLDAFTRPPFRSYDVAATLAAKFPVILRQEAAE